MDNKSIEERMASLIQAASIRLEDQKDLLERRQKPQCGQLFLHPKENEHGAVWALLSQDEHDEALFLAVPADDNPLVSGLDMPTPEDNLFGRVTLRLAYQQWIPADRLRGLRCVGILPPAALADAKEKLATILEGSVDEDATSVASSDDPAYADWMPQVLQFCEQLQGWLEPIPVREWRRAQPQPLPQPAAARRAQPHHGGIFGRAATPRGRRIQTRRLDALGWYAGELELRLDRNVVTVHAQRDDEDESRDGTLIVFLRIDGDQELMPQRLTEANREGVWALPPGVSVSVDNLEFAVEYDV